MENKNSQPEEIIPLKEPVIMQPHEQVINPSEKVHDNNYHLKQFIAGIVSVFVVVLIGIIGYYLGVQNKQSAIVPVPSNTPQPTAIVITVPIATGSTTLSTTQTPKETLATSTLGDVMTTKPGKLTLTTDKTVYRKQKDTIYATIANGLLQPIYAQDQHTNCTILALQYLENEEWKSIDDCFMGRLPAIVSTGSKRGRIIKIATKPLPPLPANDPNLFKPGLYRIAFTYSFSINGPQFGGELIRPITIYSPPFTLEK